MHEFGLCEAVLDAVERRAAGRRVRGVRVRIGARHQVNEAAFDQAFEMVSMATLADGARVEWVIVPVEVTCRVCGSIAQSTDVWTTCPRCGSSDVDVTGGDDLVLESIEVSPRPDRVPMKENYAQSKGEPMGNEGVPADKGSQKAMGVDDDDRGKTEVGQFEGTEQHGTAPDVGTSSDEVKQAGQRAWEGRDTQDASKSEEGAIYAPEKSAEKVGESITERAEERASKHKEPGRIMDESDTGDKDAGGKARPAGKSDARMSTSVDPQDPIDDESPHLPAGDQGG